MCAQTNCNKSVRWVTTRSPQLELRHEYIGCISECETADRQRNMRRCRVLGHMLQRNTSGSERGRPYSAQQRQPRNILAALIASGEATAGTGASEQVTHEQWESAGGIRKVVHCVGEESGTSGCHHDDELEYRGEPEHCERRRERQRSRRTGGLRPNWKPGSVVHRYPKDPRF